MELHCIPSAGNAKRPKKRLGSGPGSGLGKTCGRGTKGQRARTGSSIRPGFEGGQTPLYRKLPRRGFSNSLFRVSYQVVNVGALVKFDEGSLVNPQSLYALGLIRDAGEPVKLLAEGIVEKKLSVELNACSASARRKIEAAGGTCLTQTV